MLQQDTRVWTIKDLMKFAIDFLQERGIDEARLNVELLLAHTLKCQRINLYTNFDKPLGRDELKEFRKLYERRLNREPLQYIIGSATFMGLTFRVDSRVLIPRPETETLVEQTMLQCHAYPENRTVSVFEVGSGSGNIAVSLAKFVKNIHVTSIDTSEESLEVARLNAKVHQVEGIVTFLRMDVFEPVDQLLLRRFDVLVSNPPYVSKVDWEGLQLEVRKYEPRAATSDWRDGYEFFRRIVELAPYLLANGGRVAVEVGFGQSDSVSAMMQNAGLSAISVVADLQGVPRVVMGTCHSMVRNPAPLN